MDPVIQNLIRQVEKLQSEHEIAKQNFRKGVMKYEHMYVDQVRRFWASQKFTADRLRRCLHEHQSLPEFPQAYVYKKEALLGNIIEKLESEMSKFCDRVKSL